MDISGTLHLYSGEDRELFFTFDDDVAQDLYSTSHFDIAAPWPTLIKSSKAHTRPIFRLNSRPDRN
jgi:hypothetical protein